jgi:hypothetical protein
MHRTGAARVPAARNIGRADEVEQRLVGSTALAEISIQIDFHDFLYLVSQHCKRLLACTAFLMHRDRGIDLPQIRPFFE